MSKSKNNNSEDNNFLGIKSKKIMTAIIIVSVIAFSVVVFSIGKQLNDPFSFSYKINCPVDFSCSNNQENDTIDATKISALIDNQGYRVAILNDNQDINTIIDLKSSDQWPIKIAQYCFRFDDDIYVVGYMPSKDNDTLLSNKLIRCSSSGEYISTVCDYDADNSNYRYIKNVRKIGDLLEVVSVDTNSGIYIDYIEFSNNEYVIKNSNYYKVDGNINYCFYNGTDDSYIFTDYTGYSYCLKNNALSKIELNDYIQSINKNQNIKINFNFNIAQPYKFEIHDTNNNVVKEYNVSSLFFQFSSKENLVFNSNYQDNCLETVNLSSSEIHTFNEFNYSFHILLYNIVVWLCIFYSVIFIIFVFVAWLRWLSKHQSSRFLKISIGLCIFVAIIFSLSLFAIKNYSYFKEDQHKNISAVANYISKTYSFDDLSPLSLNQNKVGKDAANKNIETLSHAVNNLDNLVSSFNNQDNPISYFIYGYNPNTNQFQYIDSHLDSHFLGDNSENFDEEYISQIKSGNLVKGERNTKFFNIIYASMPLYDNNKQIIGLIEITSIMNALDYFLDNAFYELLIFVLLAIIVLFLVLKELSAFNKGIKKYKTWRIKKIPHPEIHFMDIMEFLKNFAVSVDSVLCVLIAKNMLTQYDLGDNGVLIGLPVAMFGLGSFIGASIFPYFQKNMNVKKVYYISGISIIATMLLIAFTVYIENYISYILAKLLFGVAFSILYSSDLTIPMCIDDEKQRFDTFRSLALTDVSAPIIAVLLCGFLSNVFGNYIIYIVGALMGLLVLIIAIIFIPGSSRFSNVNKKRKANMSIVLNFFKSPAVLSCLLVCLASFCIGAYKSYLFPLFSNSLNVSNVEISNYFTIASALVFVISSSLDAFSKRFDHWHNVIWNLIVIAAVFCLFNWNNTLIWAFAAFFISCLIGKGLNAEWKMLWPRKCKLENIDPADIQPIFSIFESISLTLRPIILGAFLGFGSGGACVALGVFCLVVCAIFYITTRKTPLKTNK